MNKKIFADFLKLNNMELCESGKHQMSLHLSAKT